MNMEEVLRQQESSNWFDPMEYVVNALKRSRLSSSVDLDADGYTSYYIDKKLKSQKEKERVLNNEYAVAHGGSKVNYNKEIFADPYMEYDMWDQAFRMLGGYIDCDPNQMSDSDSHSGDRRNLGGSRDYGNGCMRWIIWASYLRSKSGCEKGQNSGKNVNGNADGDDDRRFLEDEDGNKYADADDLDCHKRDSSYDLLGVYRQDYYQFLEQLTKHVWATDSYEYNIMLATLEYTSTYCSVAGYYGGEPLYVDVMPVRGGDLQMGLYTDDQCIQSLNDKDVTYDDFVDNARDYDEEEDENAEDEEEAEYDDGEEEEEAEYDDGGEEVNEGNRDRNLSEDFGDGNDYSYLMDYTLYEFNNIFDTFRKCTNCVDYPSYQDGELNGYYGTDEDVLVNQCWKFHSHDSYACEADCLALATAQGTILNIKYGGVIFGNAASKEEVERISATKNLNHSSTVYLGVSMALFVFSFISFAAARGNQKRMQKNIRKYQKGLLNDDDNGLS